MGLINAHPILSAIAVAAVAIGGLCWLLSDADQANRELPDDPFWDDRRGVEPKADKDGAP